MSVPRYDLVFDHADVRGAVLKHGSSWEWGFPNTSQGGVLDPYNWKPVWQGDGNCVAIPGLDALALVHNTQPLNLDLDDWTVNGGSGYWRERIVADPTGASTWLAFENSAANAAGQVTSEGVYPPQVVFWLYDHAPPAGTTGDVTTVLRFNAYVSGADYFVILPKLSTTERYPTLCKAVGESVYRVASFERRDAQRGRDRGGAPGFSRVEFGLYDGQWLIWLDDSAEPWLFRDPEGEVLQDQYTLTVAFNGHAGAFNAQVMTRPSSGWVAPNGYMARAPILNQVFDSYVTSRDSSGEGTVVVTEQTNGLGGSRPLVTLTPSVTHPEQSPLVYLVHDLHDTTVTTPRTSPISTQTRATALELAGDLSAELQRLSWVRRKRRNWEFQAEIADWSGYYDDILKPNMRVLVKAGLDSTAQLMEAYLADPIIERDAEFAQGVTSRVSLQGADYIMARLAGKHQWLYSPSPEGFDVDEWLTIVLHQVGFFGTLECPADMPVTHRSLNSLPRGAREKFAHTYARDDDWLPCVDAVLKSQGLTPLGVRANGNLYTEVETYYIPGVSTPDFVLDEDTAIGAEIIKRIHAQADTSDQRNCVSVAIGDSWAATIGREESYQDPADPYFIGDAQWEVRMESDLTVLEGEALAEKILRQRLQKRMSVPWSRELTFDIEVGDFGEVNVSGLGVPEGTVLEVVEERGTIDCTSGQIDSGSEFLLEIVPPWSEQEGVVVVAGAATVAGEGTVTPP